MKKIIVLIMFIFLFIPFYSMDDFSFIAPSVENQTRQSGISVEFVVHDFFVFRDGSVVIYTDVFEEPEESLEDPDIILISHTHHDHFNLDVVIQIATVSGATVVGPQVVIQELEGDLPQDQLVTLEPELYEREMVDVLGVDIRAYRGTSDLNSYRFVLGDEDISVYHSGDNIQDDFDNYVANGYYELIDLDLAFLADFGFDLEQFDTDYHPDIMIKMHLMGECEVYEDYPDFVEFGPGIIIGEEPVEPSDDDTNGPIQLDDDDNDEKPNESRSKSKLGQYILMGGFIVCLLIALVIVILKFRKKKKPERSDIESLQKARIADVYTAEAVDDESKKYFEIECPACSHEFKIQEDKKKIKCPKCGVQGEL
jgi:L-ascorbate metabolism protein UlaG (beta-lactamase superfamily)